MICITRERGTGATGAEGDNSSLVAGNISIYILASSRYLSKTGRGMLQLQSRRRGWCWMVVFFSFLVRRTGGLAINLAF